MSGRAGRRPAALAAALIATAAAACGPASEAAEETAPTGGAAAAEEVRVCEPPPADAALEPAATLVDGAGPWRLVIVAEVGDASGTRAEASLTLVQHDLPMQTLTGMNGEPIPNASAPLFGFTDLELDVLGAIPAAGLDSEDPEAPGVGLYETRPADATAQPSIILRLGSAANRRSGTAMDGASTALRVLKIEASEFRGTWRSSMNAQTRASGYFCAFRLLEGVGDRG